MSPMKRASSVDALKRGIGTAARTPPTGQQQADLPASPETPASKTQPAQTVKPARITLNLPPELYRQLQQWTTSAAETIDVPRVSQQDALRVMIRVITSGEAANAANRILAELRDELAS